MRGKKGVNWEEEEILFDEEKARGGGIYAGGGNGGFFFKKGEEHLKAMSPQSVLEPLNASSGEFERKKVI